VAGFQRAGYAAMIAAAAQAPEFVMPLISEPGIPSTMYVRSFSGPVVDTLVGVGAPKNLSYPLIYNNLGIPGANLNELLTTQPGSGDPNPFFDIVLRSPTGFGPTAVDQAINASPTMLTVWAGANDVLGSASMGTDLLLTPIASFESDYNTMMNRFALAADAIVAANLPDIAAIPFFTTIPWFIVDPNTNQPVLDPGGNLIPLVGVPPGSLVNLSAAGFLAQGDGIPIALGGTGQPLPGFVILTPSERSTIDAAIGDYNMVIDTVCQSLGIPVVNMFSLFNDVNANGVMIHGDEFTTDYISGGLFSVDGVHPSSLGYWVAAREFIRVFNADFGAAIPEPLLPVGPLRDPALGVNLNVIAAAASVSMEEWRGLWMLLGVDESDMP
ncbi:MAG: hypothetical protein IH969_09445, partial [Candidatus Krumholzibacteriota bacterium]|nr:hypothetical protein [Candidatus Krumholzibacteriota bacterium]